MRDESCNFDIYADWVRSAGISASVCSGFGGLDRSQRDQVVLVNGDEEENYQQLILARRDGIRNPVLILSFQDQRKLSEKNPILGTKCVFFLRLPLDRSDLETTLSICAKGAISDGELTYIQRWFCFSDLWRDISHNIGNLLKSSPKTDNEILNRSNEWKESIERYAPDQLDNFERFFETVNVEPNDFSLELSKKRLENLDVELRIPLGERPTTPSRTFLRVPPRGYSKVLIADDNPQEFLASSLEYEYNYEVIRPQATKLRLAKNLLDSLDPKVVLADLYFKESDRVTEVPRKEIGEDFIKYACRDDSRLVLVTSKAILRNQDLISKRAFNCSGADRATNPKMIHETICAAARSKGVTEFETIGGQDWTAPIECRYRLERYLTQLPKLISQWNHFGILVKETHNLVSLLESVGNEEDDSLVFQLQTLLEPFCSKSDFSISEVNTIFKQISSIHKSAKEGDESVSKLNIRNLLHGKIEQFSSVLNAISEFREVATETSELLSDHKEYSEFVHPFQKNITALSDSEPLTPALNDVSISLKHLIDNLPEIPHKSRNETDGYIAHEDIRFLVVEDTRFWADHICEIIEDLSNVYSRTYNFTIEVVDNVAEALERVQPRKQSDVIANSKQDIRTIAILDICLPRDREHADAIAIAASQKITTFETPSSDNGLELIRKLTEPEFNLPIIIFSTIDSVVDRKKICGFGIPESSFVSKGISSSDHLKQALVRNIERSQRYVITRREISDDSLFLINGIPLNLPPALHETFNALYELCHTTGQRSFSINELIEQHGDRTSEKVKEIIQDRIYRIRQKIYKVSQQHRYYVDTQYLIRTICMEDEEFGYELNADIPTVEEEIDYLDYWEEDIRALPDRNRIVLVSDDNDFSDLSEMLLSRGYSFRSSKIGHIETTDYDFLVFVVRSSTDAKDIWITINTTRSKGDAGILFLIEREDPAFISEAASNGISVENIIDINNENWLSRFLQVLDDEKRRVFMNESPDRLTDSAFPLIEILDGTDLDEGILELSINEKKFSMKPRSNSYLSKVLSLLIKSSSEVVSWESISEHLEMEITRNNRKTWPKRLRDIIETEWLKESESFNRELILETISDGLILNVRTIYSTTSQ